jgi:hypothetical protein
MRSSRARRLLLSAIAVFVAAGVWASAHAAEQWHGVLDEHPLIQYASRPTTDRMGALTRAVADGTATLVPDAKTGYLTPVLRALGIPTNTQVLVFSKTGVQAAFTGPQNPRALYFDESVVVGYIPGAPIVEIAAQDPQQGTQFYTIDQGQPKPRIRRLTSCLSCHVSSSTMEVPGFITRSHLADEDGNVMTLSGTHDVDHRTGHPDRWGGYFVTSEALVPYNQRAHAGNITFAPGGVTSNQVFVNWEAMPAETLRYPAATSDIVSLLIFDHQMHAANLMTRLNWEARIGSATTRLANDLAEYLLFVGEAPPQTALLPQRGYAEWFEAKFPKDRRGRSLGQLDLTTRLMRYPCSYMIYSDAFDALPPAVRQAVYARMRDVIAKTFSSEDATAVLDILRDTKVDFATLVSSPEVFE